MDFLNSLFNFFSDRKKQLSHKLTLLIISITVLVLIDNTLSFSYYHNAHNKIEEVNNINKTLTNPTLTGKEKKQLLKLRKNIIHRETWKDKAWNFISHIEFKNDAKEVMVPKFENKPIPLEESKIIKRSYFWHFISSSWLFIFIMVVMIIAAFIGYDGDLGGTISMLISFGIMLYSIAWVFTKALSTIPIILGNPTFNYFLNGILSLLISLIVYHLIKNKNTSKVE
ncbi:hypothetical protein ABW636_20990 [Aquimarina sp. 2201CG1-2-11]|uniref:hypothetical protein n=1 Tax=Aquimarina discodermiae TaxID=3231043 RepID=UPI003461F5A3